MGLLSIAGYLCDNDLNCEIIDLNTGTDWKKDMRSSLEKDGAKFAGTYGIGPREDFIREFGTACRELGVASVVGGPGPTDCPGKYEKFIDFVVTDEGEIPSLALINGFLCKGIVPGIPIDPLDMLPPTRWDMARLDLKRSGKEELSVYMSIGRSDSRRFSPERVVDDMLSAERNGATRISFCDINILESCPWLSGFMAECKDRLAGLTWECPRPMRNIPAKLIPRLKHCGFHGYTSA